MLPVSGRSRITKGLSGITILIHPDPHTCQNNRSREKKKQLLLRMRQKYSLSDSAASAGVIYSVRKDLMPLEGILCQECQSFRRQVSELAGLGCDQNTAQPSMRSACGAFPREMRMDANVLVQGLQKTLHCSREVKQDVVFPKQQQHRMAPCPCSNHCR